MSSKLHSPMGFQRISLQEDHKSLRYFDKVKKTNVIQFSSLLSEILMPIRVFIPFDQLQFGQRVLLNWHRVSCINL